MKTYQEFITNYKKDKNPYPGFEIEEIEEFKKFDKYLEDFEIEKYEISWEKWGTSFNLSKDYDLGEVFYSLVSCELSSSLSHRDKVESFKSNQNETITEFLKRVLK